MTELILRKFETAETVGEMVTPTGFKPVTVGFLKLILCILGFTALVIAAGHMLDQLVPAPLAFLGQDAIGHQLTYTPVG